MKIYISHPIAGMTEQQKAASEDAGTYYAKYILSGDPVHPRKIPPYCTIGGQVRQEVLDATGCTIPGKVLPGDTHSVQCYMRGDIAEMLACDAILVMPGWQASAGCRDEVNVAAMCGIPVHFYDSKIGVAKAPANGIGGTRLR